MTHAQTETPLSHTAWLYYRNQGSLDHKRARLTFFLRQEFMTVTWSVLLPMEKAAKYKRLVDKVLAERGINVTSKRSARLQPFPKADVFLVTVQQLNVTSRTSPDLEYRPAHASDAFANWVLTLKSQLRAEKMQLQYDKAYSPIGLEPKLQD